MFSTHSTLVFLIAACGILLFSKSACAADGKVMGVITLNGKPVAVGRIIFHQEKGQFVGAKIKDGKYTVDRVPVGAAKVTVEGKGVPIKYASEDTSALSVEIKEGKQTFDIVLQ